MKTWLLLLLLIPFAYGESIQIGEVSIEIINAAPSIKDMTLSPEMVYSDSKITCIPTVIDENPDLVTYEFQWSVDGAKLNNNGNSISDVPENSKVQCNVIAIDEYGERSTPKSAEIEVSVAPVRSKAIKPVLAAVGISRTHSQIIQATSMESITANVTGLTNSSISPILLIMIVLLLIGNLQLFRIIRRPRQGSLRAL